MRTVLIVSGVRSDGYREIRGVRIGDSESFAPWDETFRGLKGVACLEAGFKDAMAVMALPEKYRKRLRTTNMQERLSEEIRRVARHPHLPERRVGPAVDRCAAGRAERDMAGTKISDMQEYHEWAAACAAVREANNVVALSG